MKASRRPLSPITALHVFKLCFRSALFLAATVMYIVNDIQNSDRPFGSVPEKPWLLGIIACVFMIEMILRFFPSSMESMGCQKQFRKNFIPTDTPRPSGHTWRSTPAVALAWLALNGAVAVLFFLEIIDEGILVLISLFYSVCDMICILFFCPFQTWFMKNKCCGSCRIYNWDYAMMFTPLVLVVHPVSYLMLGIALLLLVAWEVQVHRHPERFSTECNAALDCAHCREKLCQHKTQLRHFLKKHKELLITKSNVLIEKGSALIEKAKSRLPSRTEPTADAVQDPKEPPTDTVGEGDTAAADTETGNGM